jgi:hypothetical protein
MADRQVILTTPSGEVALGTELPAISNRFLDKLRSLDAVPPSAEA